MSFYVAAGIVAGGSLISGIMGSNAATSAANTQAGAANQATAAQQQMFNTLNQQGAPYRSAGYSALGALLSGMGLGGGNITYDPTTGGAVGNTGPFARTGIESGIGTTGLPGMGGPTLASIGGGGPVNPSGPGMMGGVVTNGATPTAGGTFSAGTGGGSNLTGFGGLTGAFTNQDLNAYLAPNYNFMLQQGLGATANSAAAQGGVASGNTLMAINNYAQSTAQNAYQQAYSNWQNQQSNIFNRLSTIAGLGSAANQTSAAAGSAISPGIANTITGAGASLAAGTIGSTNALTSGLTGGANSIGGYYTLNSILNPTGGSTSGAPNYQNTAALPLSAFNN